MCNFAHFFAGFDSINHFLAEYAIGKKLCKDLLSILACTEDFTELSDLDLQVSILSFDHTWFISQHQFAFVLRLRCAPMFCAYVYRKFVSCIYMYVISEECKIFPRLKFNLFLLITLSNP